MLYLYSIGFTKRVKHEKRQKKTADNALDFVASFLYKRSQPAHPPPTSHAGKKTKGSRKERTRDIRPATPPLPLFALTEQ